ncbi:hypothetical protein Q5530_12730 [Saccharothrix sp. BKS2]|uniref:hypothetical protein n=1 Tax=Saccharothrix sp. BKS2 TaxID=3064400 RepID=UPI0039EC646B
MWMIGCGIGWAGEHHDVALVDEHGGPVARRRTAESVEGFTELLGVVAEAGDTGHHPIPWPELPPIARWLSRTVRSATADDNTWRRATSTGDRLEVDPWKCKRRCLLANGA